jgi:isopentenyl-diphosphate delta-isomerase type 1
MSEIILVNERNEPIGREDKLVAHQKGLLHRAFSVFIYRKHKIKNKENREILLQQRHPQKYHSGGLWTNTCCSHPLPDEDIRDAAIRRLKEEMGISADLKQIGVFQYRAELDNDLIENEIDHIFIGEMRNTPIKINIHEVIDYKWLDIYGLHQDIQDNPHYYTAWLLEALRIVMEAL